MTHQLSRLRTIILPVNARACLLSCEERPQNAGEAPNLSHIAVAHYIIMQEFFKVVVVVDEDGVLRSSGYIVSQKNLLENSDLFGGQRAAPAGARMALQLPVGPYSTFQVRVGGD